MSCVWLEEASHQFHLEKRGFTTIVLEIDRFSKTSCLFLTKINITNIIIHNNVMITKRWRRWDDEDEDEDEENYKEDNDDEDMIKITITTSAIIVLMVADSNPPGPTTGEKNTIFETPLPHSPKSKTPFHRKPHCTNIVVNTKDPPPTLLHTVTLLFIKR